MLTRVQTEAGGGTSSSTYNEAWQNLQTARRQLGAGDYKRRLVSARWSRNLFSSLLDDLRNKAPSGEAQFVGVQGGWSFGAATDLGKWRAAASFCARATTSRRVAADRPKSRSQTARAFASVRTPSC